MGRTGLLDPPERLLLDSTYPRQQYHVADRPEP